MHAFLRTPEVTAVTGVHLVRLPPATANNPRGPRALSPTPDWRPWRSVWAEWLASLSFQCRRMATGPWLLRATATNSPPPPPAPHGTAHDTPPMHWEVMGQALLQPRTPTSIIAMSDSNGSPGQDDRHHRRSRSRTPVSPGYAGETSAEREERQLAEAAVTVWPPAEQPQADRSDPKPQVPDPMPAGKAAPAAQVAASAAPPPGGAPEAHGAAAAAPVSHATAPRHVAGTADRPWAGPGRSPGTATATAEGREGAEYRAHTKPWHTQVSPPKPYPRKAAFTEGRPRPVRAPTPKRTLMGITPPQLKRCVVQAGGGGGGVPATEAQGEGRKGTEGGWQAEGEGRHQGRVKARAAAQGDRHEPRTRTESRIY